jgi:sodium-dependent dicarboxylate transporter 2/3/5
MLLLLSYAATAGGMMTLVGTPPNLIGAGLIAAQAGTAISFLTWMAAGLPIGILLLAISFGAISRQWASVNFERTDLQRQLREQAAALGPWTHRHTTTCLVFGLAVAGWLLPGILKAVLGPTSEVSSRIGRLLSPEVVAMGAAALLFVVPTSLKDGATTLRWPHLFRVNWGILLLFGGGLALGDLTMRTGLGEVAGRGIVGLFGVESVWSLTAGAITMAVLVSELVSNTVAASLVIPLVIATAQAAGVSPVPPALGACFASSLGFLLPVSTAPNAIVYATGLVPLFSMMRAGIVIDLFGSLSIWIALRLMLPLLGLV